MFETAGHEESCERLSVTEVRAARADASVTAKCDVGTSWQGAVDVAAEFMDEYADVFEELAK